MPLCSVRCTSSAKLTGKTAIITGCNTGIGKETALDFYKRGASIFEYLSLPTRYHENNKY